MTQPPTPPAPEPNSEGPSSQGPNAPQPPHPGVPQGGGNQPPPQYPGGSQGSLGGSDEPRKNQTEGRGFFSALFDLSFKSFVAVKFASFIYVLLMIAIVIGWLITMIGTLITTVAAASENGFVAFLLFLAGVVGGTIWAFVQLIILRVVLEFMIAAIRTAQNTGAAVEELEELNARK
ncbi:DUF4282 domain-containing protein [Nesterenkonia populi]